MSKNVGKALNKESDFCCLLKDTVIKSETVRGDYMQLVQDVYKIIENGEFIKWLIVTVITSLVIALTNTLIYSKLFSVKIKSKKDIVIVTLTETFFKCIYSMIVPIYAYRIVCLITEIIIYKFYFKQKVEKCILGATINSIIIVFSEAVFSKFLCLFYEDIKLYVEGIYNYKYKSWLILSVAISRIMIYYIINKKNIKVKIREDLNKRERATLIAISIIGEIVIYFNVIEMTIFISDFPYEIFITDIIALIAYFYISISNFTKMVKLEKQATRIHNLEAYNKTLSIMYDSIRGFKHDYANMLQALSGYVLTGDLEQIKKICDNMLQECIEVNEMGILDPNIINDPGVYSILTTKYYMAQESNIKMNIEVMTDLTKIEITSYELCKILAILLDNAIEAAKQTEEKLVNVRMARDFRMNRDLIIIENSYINVDVDINEMFEKGYTSKKEKSNDHGLGLWNVKRILNKSKNLNLFTTKGKLFCQQLEIYSKCDENVKNNKILCNNYAVQD